MFSIFIRLRSCVIELTHYNTGFETGIFRPEIAPTAFKKNGWQGWCACLKRGYEELLMAPVSVYPKLSAQSKFTNFSKKPCQVLFAAFLTFFP